MALRALPQVRALQVSELERLLFWAGLATGIVGTLILSTPIYALMINASIRERQ